MAWTIRSSLCTSALAYLRTLTTRESKPTPATIAGILLYGAMEDKDVAIACVRQLMDPQVRQYVAHYLDELDKQESAEVQRSSQPHLRLVTQENGVKQ